MNTGWNRFFKQEDQVLAVPSWEAPRLLIVSYSLKQRWVDSGAYYPAFRLRAKIFKLFIRMSVALFPSVFVYKPSTDKVAILSNGIAKMLDYTFKSFRYSSTGQSLFPAYFKERGILSQNDGWDIDLTLRDELLGFIQGAFSEHHRCSLLTGSTAHDKRKLIIQCRAKSGSILGYIKYGEKRPAQECILHEAECLPLLPPGLAPVHLGLVKEGDFSCVALSPITGTLLPAKLPRYWSDLVEYLKRLEQNKCYSAESHPFILNIRHQLSDLVSEVQWSNWVKVLQNESWPVVFQHGDFAPWNIYHDPYREKESALVAIDWEEGSKDGFPYLDLAYFCLQTGFLMNYWGAAESLKYTTDILCKHVGLTEPVADVVVRLSALDAWLRSESTISGSELQQFRKLIWTQKEGGL